MMRDAIFHKRFVWHENTGNASANPNDEQLSNIELRSELNYRSTPVGRKLQIIRVLFDRGKCLLMEEVDRNLYYELSHSK